MLNLEFAAHYAACMISALLGILLILRKKDGEASRVYLGVFYLGMSLIFGYECYLYYYNLYPDSIIKVPYVIIGVLYSVFYLIYPIEVIAPGFMNRKRFFYLFSPLVISIVVYLLTAQQGVEYEQFDSLSHLFSSPLTYSSVFIYVLFSLMLIPLFLLYRTPYTKRYNNTNKKWIARFIFMSCITTIGFIFKLYHSNEYGFIHVPVYFLFSAYIIYLELFVRIIQKQKSNQAVQMQPVTVTVAEEKEVSVLSEATASYNSLLQNRIVQFLDKEKSWRDPDFSIQDLINKTGITRKELSNAIQEMGYDNFPHYLNTLRVNDFTSTLAHGKFDSFQNLFFEVGFRSRATAHRNFKQVTGESPSEYFAKIRQKGVK